MIKKKAWITFLFVCLALAIFQVKAINDSDYEIRSLNNFLSYFPQGMSILFQMPGGHDETSQYVALLPTLGNFNGSACSLWIASNYGGSYSVTAEENCVLTLTESLGAVRVNGVAYGMNSTIPINAGTSYTFEWSYTMDPIVPFSLILGIIGLSMTFGGPLYMIHSFRQGEYRTALITCTIITLVGGALVIGWFWT